MRGVVLALLFLVSVVVPAHAKFADTVNFSGKHGVDCGACHAPTTENVAPPAEVAMSGLPAAWDVAVSYRLTIHVSGGPPAAAVPGQPQGGFELESDGGTFAAPPGMEELLRFPDDDGVTYTSTGTLRRTWEILWTAPALDLPPAPVRFWLAAVAADGNHIMEGPAAAGERGDRVATANFTVVPSARTQQAWAMLPLPAPQLEAIAPDLKRADFPLMVRGAAASFVEVVEWRLDEGAWNRAAGSTHFLFLLDWPGEGPHTIEVRSLLGDRISQPAAAALDLAGAGSVSATPDARPATLLLWFVPLALAGAFHFNHTRNRRT